MTMRQRLFDRKIREEYKHTGKVGKYRQASNRVQYYHIIKHFLHIICEGMEQAIYSAPTS